MGGRKSHFNFASVNTSSSLDEVKRNPGWPVQGMPRIPRCFIRATVMFSKNEMARWTIDLMGGGNRISTLRPLTHQVAWLK